MDKPRVAIVKCATIFSPSGDADPRLLKRMFERGLALSLGEREARDGLGRIFRRGERIGIKVNTIAGRRLSTGPDVALPLAEWLADNGAGSGGIIVWDRTNRELREAGYRLSPSSGKPKVFGTDTDGVGYGSELVVNGSMGSLVSAIQRDRVDASISLALLKDHGLAGVTGGIKNYFGAIHNPNKGHDNRCDPAAAEVFGMAPIRNKHRLSILDALTVQFHRGPSYHAGWAAICGTLVFGLDPVAVDAVGRKMIDDLRAGKGLPSLAEEGRAPLYLESAEKMGFGTAGLGRIGIVEETI